MSAFKNHLIDSEKQSELFKEYETTNYRIINERRALDRPDARTFTFDLQVLEDYLSFIKKEAKKLGYADIKVKIEMAKYPEVSSDSKVHEAYKGYQTVYLVAADANKRDSEGNYKTISEIDGLNYSHLCPPYGII